MVRRLPESRGHSPPARPKAQAGARRRPWCRFERRRWQHTYGSRAEPPRQPGLAHDPRPVRSADDPYPGNRVGAHRAVRPDSGAGVNSTSGPPQPAAMSISRSRSSSPTARLHSSFVAAHSPVPAQRIRRWWQPLERILISLAPVRTGRHRGRRRQLVTIVRIRLTPQASRRAAVHAEAPAGGERCSSRVVFLAVLVAGKSGHPQRIRPHGLAFGP